MSRVNPLVSEEQPKKPRKVLEDHPATGTTERGRWLMCGWLSNSFYIYTRRRVDRVFDDDTAAFTVLGQKQEVDTASVLSAVERYREQQKELA